MNASVIIRTFNEERYLAELLTAIYAQQFTGRVEVLLVDSGSTDNTLEIAREHGCRVINVARNTFSFGRSLNRGCAEATGEILVFISGHCVPRGDQWLRDLTYPIARSEVSLAYGNQRGGSHTQFSEEQVFRKFFPDASSIPQTGFFCNNANAALLKTVWKKFQFDESLTGLEDMHLAKRITSEGLKVAYVAEACVSHLHHETWGGIRRRYEREAIALQHIMPEIHLSLTDTVRYFLGAVAGDVGVALQEKRLLQTLRKIVMFRLMQFWGSYRGNHDHRLISKERKELYFYRR